MFSKKKSAAICRAFIFCVLAIIIVPTDFVLGADEGVIIAPTRLVFSGRDRSEIVRLVNKDSVARRFRLSLIHINMDHNGTRLETETPDQNQLQAQDMIRFSPRQVTIPPDGWQTVRVMVRKPQGLVEGEYRAHLKFALIPEPEEKKLPGEVDSNEAAGLVGIKINIIMNVTIPIIVRHGPGSVEVLPQEVVLKKDEKTGGRIMNVTLFRSGKYSLYADIAVFDDSVGDKPVKLGEIRGVGVYTPNTVQYVPVPVQLESAGDLRGKSVRVEIRDRENEKEPLLVSRVLSIM